MKSAVAADLGRHLQNAIGDVVERHARTAHLVITPGEVMLLMVEAAVGLSISAAATVAASCDPDKAGDMYDSTLAMIAAGAASDRSRALKEAAARRAQG